MCHIQIACSDLMQHGSEEREVLPVDQRNLYIAIASERLFQPESGVEATEPTTKNQYLFARACTHCFTTPFC
jgi:hypothetical protein